MWESAITLTLLLIACGGGDSAEATKTVTAGSEVARVEEAASQIVATFAEAAGTIEVRRQGQVRWERVAVGTTLRERDWVRSGPRSFARLRFTTRGFLDLSEGTTILIDKAITVESGVVAGIVQGDQPLAIVAPDGSKASLVAAADGEAAFRLTPTASKALEIAVTKGNLTLSTTAGQRAVAAGEASDLAQNTTTEVVKLLGFPKSIAPGVDARFLFTAGMKIPLSWKAVPGASRYLVQVATDTEFHNLVVTAEPKDLGSSFPPNAEGIFAWRVAARDVNGRLGEFGFARRIYCENDEPRDLLIGPRDGFKIDFPNTPPAVQFSWRPQGEAKNYKLVIHRGVPGIDPPITKTTTAQQLSVTLDEGAYSWGIYAVKPDREDPIFLNLRQLTITKQAGPKIRTEVQWNAPR